MPKPFNTVASIGKDGQAKEIYSAEAEKETDLLALAAFADCNKSEFKYPFFAATPKHKITPITKAFSLYDGFTQVEVVFIAFTFNVYRFLATFVTSKFKVVVNPLFLLSHSKVALISILAVK